MLAGVALSGGAEKNDYTEHPARIFNCFFQIFMFLANTTYPPRHAFALERERAHASLPWISLLLVCSWSLACWYVLMR